MPTYNRAPLLSMTLRSIAEQEYARVEAVVVDDGSTDATAEVVDACRRIFDERSAALKYRRLATTSGPAAARNLAVSMAEGSLLAFIDSDDAWRRRFLATTVPLLDAHPECAVAFSGAERLDAAGRPLGPLDHGLPLDPSEGVLRTPFERLVRHMPFRTSCTLLRSAEFHAVGGFDEALRSGEDWDLWWRLAKRVDFAYTLEVLMDYRDHPGNLSKTLADGPAHSLRFHFKHVADVRDPAARAADIARIQRRQIELQELLLAQGRRRDAYRDMLDNAFTPRSLRFRAGRAAMRAPASVGRTYVRALRLAGRARRKVLSAYRPR